MEQLGHKTGSIQYNAICVETLALVFQSYREELEGQQASHVRAEEGLDEATQRPG